MHHSQHKGCSRARARPASLFRMFSPKCTRQHELKRVLCFFSILWANELMDFAVHQSVLKVCSDSGLLDDLKAQTIALQSNIATSSSLARRSGNQCNQCNQGYYEAVRTSQMQQVDQDSVFLKGHETDRNRTCEQTRCI